MKGFATTTNVGWDENKTHIITNQEVKITEYVKGQSFGDTLLLQRFGGCVVSICEGVEEGGAYEEGSEITLYLKEINGELVKVC